MLSDRRRLSRFVVQHMLSSELYLLFQRSDVSFTYQRSALNMCVAPSIDASVVNFPVCFGLSKRSKCPWMRSTDTNRQMF